ncbi:MAG: hypothetical protein ACR2GN_07170 [Bacteroidia bacterium]
MDPLFSQLDLKFDGSNAESLLSKAKTTIKDYKNNNAYLEFWPLVEGLESALMKHEMHGSVEAMNELCDVMFEIHLVDLYQTADKKYNLLKETVQQGMSSGGTDALLYEKHYEKFTRIEQDYVV